MTTAAHVIIQKWRPGLTLYKDKPDKLPLWIKIHDIPYEAWSDEGLSHIASKVGKPLAMDSYTADMCIYAASKSVYARVLLEVPIRYSWVDKVLVRIPDPDTLEFSTHTLRIEYEWKPPLCTHCMVYGHETHSYIHVISKANDNNVKNKTVLEQIPVTTNMEIDDGFTVVTKKKNVLKQVSTNEKRIIVSPPSISNGIPQSNSLDNDECIEVDSDDGETAQFVAGEIGSPHDHLMKAPESEQMDSTPSRFPYDAPRYVELSRPL
ncbi:hypothetical protein L2E82_35630 [Cichorium intybus]|uniref:Uncharacterized protein n=1 Tax=Cichorium intybus TaxID=13427 RepID=A0ACB9BPG0_CICIN|nr:hypothetical protein L2E82_35630 [Cichorium intybus]